MCGIVGLYLKNPKLQPKLGQLFKPMLIEMTSRGPDSAGVAIYRNPAKKGFTKFSLAHDDAKFGWKKLAAALKSATKKQVSVQQIGNHAIVTTNAKEEAVTAWLKAHHPEVRVVGSGQAIEIFKETGLPEKVYEKFDLGKAKGSHIIGHTRMATESAVTMEGSHPFSTGADLCLVHNGSLSNHFRMRQELKRHGITFETGNDTEVAAGYLTWRLREGDDLKTALDHALDDLDGFYTFAIGTRNGFAVIRDPISCKPAILAETEDYVAMASEYQALASLPGIEKAKVWEPEPATLYIWEKEAV
jgi:methylamine---glutamate N-methyltransferase subunit A